MIEYSKIYIDKQTGLLYKPEIQVYHIKKVHEVVSHYYCDTHTPNICTVSQFIDYEAFIAQGVKIAFF